jgi:quercetin 2,3-dioxygenase
MVSRMTVSIVVHRGADRFRTQTDWLESWHSFSYGPHYDPTNTHFGLLVACNDDVVAPGGGFGMHQHRDMEIITWVISGALTHEDFLGNRGVVRPGQVQRMSAGTGIMHSERNDGAEPVRYVQMWVLPSEIGPPDYVQAEVEAALAAGGLVPLVSGRGDAPVRIRQRGATLYAARLTQGEQVVLPAAPYVHSYVTRGSVELEAVTVLGAGDAARVTGSDGCRVVTADAAEVLVWTMTN